MRERNRKGITPRKSGQKLPKKLFVIASEGADTERIYFEALQQELQKKEGFNGNIKIKFLIRDDRTKSSHKFVLAQLDKYKKEFQLNN